MAITVDRHVVSTITFVDTPGLERLAMDPEILRLREGATVNRSVLAFGNCVRALSSPGQGDFVNYGESVLTKLIGESLGGDCFTVGIAHLKMGQWDQSSNTMKYGAMLRRVATYPCENHEARIDLVWYELKINR